jgi:heme a synthase
MMGALHKMTLAALLLCIVMTVLSAHIRLSDSGIGCEPWPDCFYSSFAIDDAPGITIKAVDANKGLRVFHRITASVFGLIAVILFVFCLWFRKRLAVPIIPVTVVLLLTLVLAMVGMNTPDIVHPLVTTINLGGGMLLCAVLYRFRLSLLSAETAHHQSLASGLLMLAGLVTYVCIVSGAWTSANFAAGSCDRLMSCSHEGKIGLAFDPSRALVIEGGAIISDAETSMIVLYHQLVAFALAILLIGIGLHALLQKRTEALIYLIMLTCLMLAAAVPVTGLLLAELHNLFSLLLLLTLVHQYHYSLRGS